MNLTPIYDAILARIRADTGAGGLYVGGAFTLVTGGWTAFEGPIADMDNIPAPFGTFSVSAETDDTFTSDGLSFTVEFNIFAPKVPAANGGGLALLEAAKGRLFGDAMLQTGRAPSYGFHRHPLSLSSNSAINPLGITTNGGLIWQGATQPASVSATVISVTTTFRGFASVFATSP